jgi:hypothetical protein
MSIDDPLQVAQALVAHDERQTSVVTGFVVQLLELVDLPGITLIDSALQRRRIANMKLLMDTLSKDMTTLHHSQSITKEQMKYLREEFPSLVQDALLKAQFVRGNERIQRIAGILMHSVEVAPRSEADQIEEMMRLAAVLSDGDVVVLEAFVETQHELVGKSLDVDGINKAWKGMRVATPPTELLSICAKLQSLGLIVQVERRQVHSPPDAIPYGLLPRGRDFITYIKGLTVA